MGAFIHSLVDSSAPSILPPRVRVLRTPSTRLSFIAKFVFVKTSKINKKETGLGPFKNKRTLGRLFSFFAETILVLEMLIALTRSTPRPMTPPSPPQRKQHGSPHRSVPTPVVNVIKLFFWGGGKSRKSLFRLTQSHKNTYLDHLISSRQFRSEYT